MRLSLALFAAIALPLTACDRTRVITVTDAGPLCGDNETLVNGQCRFVCNRDGDCASGERCNLLTGRCETRQPAMDSGVPPIPCTEGAVRCSSDTRAVERCGATGAWTVDTQCPMPDGYCQNERCLACRPGATKCGAGNTTVEICADDGSAWRQVTCAGMATCVSGECRECNPGQKRCSADGKSVQECQRLPREDLTYGFVNAGDNFDGTCVTQVCEMGASGPQCRVPACVPGSTQCLNSATQQVCSATGSYTNVACTTALMSPTAECINGACIDECGDAARAKSYFGCEYWGVQLTNAMDRLFKGNTASGQGSTDSDFVFVVTNQSTLPATVEVWRYAGGAPVRLKSVTVPGRNDTATKGLVKIPVPWQSLTPANASTGTGTTGQARYGWRLTSTRPITVYQFSPIDAVKVTNRSCSAADGDTDCNCNEYSDFSSTDCAFPIFSDGHPGVCRTQTGGGKRCTYGTYSNDASLLLPSHILGTSYVSIGPMHVRASQGSTNVDYPGEVAIVATQDNTVVTVKAAAAVQAGGSIATMARGETRNFTLNAYDVLQLASLGTGSNLECYTSGGVSVCRKDSDLTGTVVTSTKPVAVFSGSPCLNNPYNRPYCDHVEEQMFPFASWGKDFVGLPSAPLRLNNNNFATNPPPDHFKVVAGCPASQCPNGTLLTLSASIPTTDILLPNNCLAGTSLTANNCRLAGGTYIEFKRTLPFTLTADQPVAVAQILPGQGTVTGLPTDPAQGDPSLILLPPVQQWRSSYTVLASTGLRDNYLGLSIDSAKVQSVAVDGVVVTGFTTVGSTTFQTKNFAVSTGTHTIQVTPKAGQTVLPGAGVTVYGYDAQVSYGYTGGLDLGTIVTGINPGG